MKPFLSMMCIGALLLSGCVAPDQYRVLENRITAIEADNNRQTSGSSENIDGVKEQLSQATQVSTENYAEIKYEIQLMKEKLQQTDGLIEEIQHKFGSKTQVHQDALEKRLERLDLAISKNYEKILALEQHMGFEPSESLKVKEGGVTDPPVTADSEQALYDLAKKMFDDGDRDGARIQFENFINKYPESKKSDNARFWIADSYYAEKWYEKAILEYQKVLEKYPDSNKTAAARLKQGYAFAELGEKANARLILKELIKRHPDSKEAQYATEKLKGLN